jgi:hypothetical protein
MADEDSISIWTAAEAAIGTSKAALPKLGGGITAGATEVVSVSVDTVRKNLSVFLEQIGPLLESSGEALKNYDIDEIELNIAINASGGVELVGKLQAGAEAGLKIKLKRRPDSK